jgi:hypothetical protein
MAALPELAPAHKNRLLGSSSIVTKIIYQSGNIQYSTYDNVSDEVLRLISKPETVTIDGTPLKEIKSQAEEGWSWKPLDKGGVLEIKHTTGNEIQIIM